MLWKIKVSNKKRIGLLFICLFLFTSVPLPVYAFDMTGGTSESNETVLRSSGDVSLAPMTAHTASTGTRWKTVGFYITASTTGHQGVHNAKSEKSFFRLKNSWAKDVVNGATTKTYFTIPASVIRKAIENAGIDTSDTNVVYLQGVLEGRQVYSNGSYKKLTKDCFTVGELWDTTRSGSRYLYNRTGGIGWPSRLKEDWKQRHDIKLTLKGMPMKAVYYRYTPLDERKSGEPAFERKYYTTSSNNKWTSSATGYDSIKEGNGLNFKYDSVQGGISKVRVTFGSSPGNLKKVNGYDYKYTYLLYRISWSYAKSKVQSNGRKPHNNIKSFPSKNAMLTKDGHYTTSYQNWLDDVVRQTKHGPFKYDDEGIELNFYYKKAKRESETKKETVENEDTNLIAAPGAVIQADARPAEKKPKFRYATYACKRPIP